MAPTRIRRRFLWPLCLGVLAAPDRSYDMFKPHLFPLNMPVCRVAYFANGDDVDTVIVNGEILMEGRRVRTVDEAEVLELAQRARATSPFSGPVLRTCWPFPIASGR